MQKAPGKFASKNYMDSFVQDSLPACVGGRGRAAATRIGKQQQKFPPEPVRDVVLFVLGACAVESWQLDVLLIIVMRPIISLPRARPRS